jgi:type II pantothenate kinase
LPVNQSKDANLSHQVFSTLQSLPDAVAIDFGSSNTDMVVVQGGRVWTRTEPTVGRPDAEVLRRLLSEELGPKPKVGLVAVTGGHHQLLPDSIDELPIKKIGELVAIARGGQAWISGSIERPKERVLVVSAGSGTAMVLAHDIEVRHITGTGVGGGTLLGLGHLLLGCSDPVLIDEMAGRGNPSTVDLGIADVVSGPIGSLPPDATAVNFGRAAQALHSREPQDLAAGLVNMVGQVVATLAVNAGRAAGAERITVTGHLTDMASIRIVISRVGDFFGFPIDARGRAGCSTVVGALLRALGQ